MAYKLTCKWYEKVDITWAYLDKATRKMKKWANLKRHHVEYKEGDQVMIKLLPQQFKTLYKVLKGLVTRSEGSLSIVRHVDNILYQLQLSPRLNIDLVFHVSLLKLYHGDVWDPSWGESRRALIVVVSVFNKGVECILIDRVSQRRSVPIYNEYLVKRRDLIDNEVG